MSMKSAPQVGAILFAFLPEEGGVKRAKLRPVVVLDTEEINGLTYLTVAKGTSQHTNLRCRGELLVHDETDLIACGLNKPTKFQLRRSEKLPFTRDWFNTRITGMLPKHLLRSLIAAAVEAHLI